MSDTEWRSSEISIRNQCCGHSRKVEETHLRSADWSRSHELRVRELIIEGLRVERCLDCKSLRLLRPVTAQLVDQIFGLLASTTPGSSAARARAAKPQLFPPPLAAAPPAPPVPPSDAVPVATWTARPARRKPQWTADC